MGASTDEIADQLAVARSSADENVRALGRRAERTVSVVLPRAAGGALMAAGLALVGAAAVLAVRALRRPSLRDELAGRVAGARTTAVRLGRSARDGLPLVQVTVGRQERRRTAIGRQAAIRFAQAAGTAAGTAAARRLVSRA